MPINVPLRAASGVISQIANGIQRLEEFGKVPRPSQTAATRSTVQETEGVRFYSWNQTSSAPGVFWSVLTGICVGVGTIFFFVLFQKGGPLSAVPMVLAGGAALMAIAGILFFKEPATFTRVAGIIMALVGLLLLRSPGEK
jgi:multidrug transporter EmrE-like cation transporter